MKKIILLSDTHSALDERFLPHIEDANEIWHAGDIGDALTESITTRSTAPELIK